MTSKQNNNPEEPKKPRSAASKPAAGKPAAKKAAEKKPTAKNAAVKKPTAKNAAVKKPATAPRKKTETAANGSREVHSADQVKTAPVATEPAAANPAPASRPPAAQARTGARQASPAARASQPKMSTQRMLAIAALIVVAFFGAYNFSASQSQAGAAGQLAAGLGDQLSAPVGGGCGSAGASGGGGGCCGGGGEPVEGATVVDGNTQTVDVDTSQGSFSPNVIKAKAGVPIEINFSQAPGGCLSGVSFPDFNIDEDLTSGPKTVTLPALEKGEYSFFCQMQMVSATIVVE